MKSKIFILLTSILLIFYSSTLKISAQTCNCVTNNFGICEMVSESCGNVGPGGCNTFPSSTTCLPEPNDCYCNNPPPTSVPPPTDTPRPTIPISTNTPGPSINPPSCATAGQNCYTAGSQSNCCFGYTCSSSYQCQLNPTASCQTLNEGCGSNGSQSNCCYGYWCSNYTCQPLSCQTQNQGCGTNGVQSNCCNGYICTNYTCQPNSNNCCFSSTNSFCASLGGTTYSIWYSCLAQGCSWKDSCPHYTVPTPIPTRPVPKVFCHPPDGGPTDDESAGGIWTNLGCVPYESRSFTSTTMAWGIGLAGGVAFLVIGYAALLFLSSGGDPKKIQAARELIIALVGGMALIIFGVLLLNYLGVNILNLQDLGFRQ